MLWINRIVGAAIIVAAFPLWQLAAAFPAEARQFPRFTLAAIVVLAAIMIARSFVASVEPVRDGEGARTTVSLVRPLAVFALVVLAVVAMRFVGFVPAMAVLALLFMPLLQVGNRAAYGLACASLLVFIYVLFVAFLGVPLTASRYLTF